MRRFWLLVLLLNLFIAVFPSHAAQSSWSVWLYTQTNGAMRQIDSTGTVIRELALPLPSGASNMLPNQVAVSHDGNLFAYLAAFPNDTQQLVIWDTALSSFIGSYNFPAGAYVSLQSYASPDLFSEMDGQFAFGYGTMAGQWQVLIFDLLTQGIFVLDGSSPASVALGADSASMGGAAAPIVQAYRGGQVHFTLTAMTQAFIGASFVWDTLNGTLNPTGIYPTIYGDTLMMTGEVVVPALDENFAMRGDTMLPLNTVRVHDPAVGANFPFVEGIRNLIESARFVQNGELIAVVVQTDTGVREIELYGRSGGRWGYYAFAPISLEGVFDGFVFTGFSPTRPTATELYFENTRTADTTGDVARIWQSPDNEFIQIVWTSDNFMLGPVEPPPWAMIGAPEMVSSSTALGAPPLPTATGAVVFIPPTLAPQVGAPLPSGLAVGADAIVNTTDGDKLRLRNGPGRSFEIIAELDDGTMVTLLEGPRAADGFTWWRVRLGDGRSGWVVESADNVQTLEPLFAG